MSRFSLCPRKQLPTLSFELNRWNLKINTMLVLKTEKVYGWIGHERSGGKQWIKLPEKWLKKMWEKNIQLYLRGKEKQQCRSAGVPHMGIGVFSKMIVFKRTILPLLCFICLITLTLHSIALFCFKRAQNTFTNAQNT